MSDEILTMIGIDVALAGVILPAQWALRRDMADVCERLARLEGVDILTKFLIERERPAAGS